MPTEELLQGWPWLRSLGGGDSKSSVLNPESCTLCAKESFILILMSRSWHKHNKSVSLNRSSFLWCSQICVWCLLWRRISNKLWSTCLVLAKVQLPPLINLGLNDGMCTDLSKCVSEVTSYNLWVQQQESATNIHKQNRTQCGTQWYLVWLCTHTLVFVHVLNYGFKS